ncbi:gamma-glutamylcyclotransferase [Amorphus sp. 3PC139-8]|uniref:gamma-glutamylcyclotransferase n=1 Tax=Amorphus sp. 3PC139-8 TaxID=2735676 RepID=UPI00345D9C08
MNDLWVFGYGSLMWRPGFPFLEAAPARIKGRHRRLCVYSWVHRGTEAEPGLVLGLDRGGSCLGRVFRVAAEEREATIDYLRAREQVTMVYLERTVRAALADGSDREVSALTYVVDRSHAQYAGPLPRERQLEIVRTASGQSGPNPDYVLATADHLEELGVHDDNLHWIADALRGRVKADATSA